MTKRRLFTAALLVLIALFAALLLLSKHGPVSYTHLDVYKRQGEEGRGLELRLFYARREARGQGVAGVYERVAQRVVLVGELDGCLLYTSRCV